MRNKTAFFFCLLGGFLLIISGYTEGVSNVFLLYNIVHSIPSLAPYYWLIDIGLFFLLVIAVGGGFAVIAGGYLLTTDHVLLGKLIIAVASGFGILSLIITIIQVVAAYGVAGLFMLARFIANTAWALGLILTIIARFKAS